MTSLDYYAIEDLLTDDERAARDRTRRFVREEVMPEVVPSHRAAKFPEKVRARMGALRLFAPYLKEHGCAGLSYTAYGLIMQELERADSGLRSEASVQGALAIYAIHSFATPEQHARWLPGLVSGERVGCFALTEHGHGSDPGGMETRAKRDGDHYILNGSKCWIGNASIADVKVIWAKDDDGRVGGFVVEKDAPGFRAQDIEGKFSLRMSRTSSGSLVKATPPMPARPVVQAWILTTTSQFFLPANSLAAATASSAVAAARQRGILNPFAARIALP